MKSSEVTKWFKNILNKKEYTFTNFDIQEFYPSITEDLLKKSNIICSKLRKHSTKKY